MGKLVEIHPVRLTDIEIADRSFAMSSLIEDNELREAEVKASNAEAKEWIKETKAEISRLARVLRERQEMREVELREEYDYPNRKVHVVRCDTSEVVRVREMTDEERQLVLFHGDKAVAAGETLAPAKASASPETRAMEAERIDSLETTSPSTLVPEILADVSQPIMEEESTSIGMVSPAVSEPEMKPAKNTRAKCGVLNSRGKACAQPVILGTDRCSYHPNE